MFRRNSSYSDRIQHIKDQSNALGAKIKSAYAESKALNDDDLCYWLQLRNIINMHKVCISYEVGSAFYGSDANHEVVKFMRANSLTTKHPIHTFFNTSINMDPIRFYQKPIDNVTPWFVERNSYMVSDDADASDALNDLLFTRTSLDCAASIHLTNYLTLLDVLTLMHGPILGKKAFNSIFNAKADTHNLNRLRIGTMFMVDFYGNDWFAFTPLYFLTQCVDSNVCVKELKSNPNKYIGTAINFNIAEFIHRNHVSYATKHPEGFSAAWNVIYMGTAEDGEPLFLAARSLGKKSILRLDELITILTHGYNQLPAYEQSKYKDEFYQHDPSNFNISTPLIFFNVEKIKLLISNLDEFKRQLGQYCDRAYRNKIPPEYKNKKPDALCDDAMFLSSLWIKDRLQRKEDSRDDHDMEALRLAKHATRDPYPLQLTTRDDSDIKYNMSKLGL